jgi:hypothetical protein
VLGGCLVLVIVHPEYAGGAALAAGMVLGAYFPSLSVLPGVSVRRPGRKPDE